MGERSDPPKFTTHEHKKKLTEVLRRAGFTEEEINNHWAAVDGCERGCFAAWAKVGGFNN